MTSSSVQVTCGKLRQVLLLLSWISKQQNALKADGLVGTQSDANTQVMTANDLNQPGILRDQIDQSDSRDRTIFSHVSIKSNVPECL